ncbi:sentrin-specific protease 2-like [Pipra filicauda]|uniref:Sentrin-specific protease 2-like n=1 Tax=Pipra filicauda TaxID=649802 RepID=A0A6J2HC22_9PASS|nr:sentrin-specific protease 2-like [Pipra filicauda]
MYQWLLGALRALRAAARPQPAPQPGPDPRSAKRPLPSVASPVEDPDSIPEKKQKTECLICGTDKRPEDVPVAAQLPPKATSGCQEASGGDATSLPEPGKGAQATSDSSFERAADSVADEDRVEVGKMPCDTNTCLAREALSLPYKGVPYLSLNKNNHHIQPAPDSPVTPRPPIKELPVPGPTSPGANSVGRPLCAAEEDVRRGESQKYKEILKLFKEKYSGCLNSPQPANFNKVQTHSREPVVTGSHLKGQKSRGVYPGVTQRASVKHGDVFSPQLPQRGVMISYYTPPEDSHGQGIPGKQAVAVGRGGAEVSQGMLFQFHVTPVLSKDFFFVDREPLPCSEKPAEDFAPLTEAMEREVSAAFGKGEPGEILSSAFKLKVTREDICTLQQLCWLNDEVINFYMNLLVERSKKEGYPALHAFSTFFYPKLCSGGYKAVRRWTRGVDLFKQDLILVPIHLRVHWTLLVIDVRKKTIKYFDSLGQKGDNICKTLLQYLQEESREKRKLELTASEWTLRSLSPEEIPQQTNGSDCGVFVCKFADSISRDKPITFTQEHMPYFRRKMVWEIIHQQLL